MKQASIHLKLSKEMSVVKHEVTPIEALVLVAEHQRNVGDCPIDLREVTNEIDAPKVDGKERTDDQELDRLRAKYGRAKVQNVSSQVKDFPKTFKEAVERGMKISIPSGMGGVVAEVKLL